MGDEEDMEILKESMLTRKAKKPQTTSSKSSQNLAVEVGESAEGDKEIEPQISKGPDYKQLVHSRKILEGEPSDINPEVFDMIPPHLQWTLTTVDLFWTHGWADYSIKSSARVKLSALKALVARSLVLIEEAKFSVQDLELNKTSMDNALRNAENIIKDQDRFKERINWL
ncbi:hypothetical protein Fot_37640 [Forsythia ovata]|uniref:Uncharacterized protein n=1 Tax=Forsythia ovata TaxID=205694 RepID=A0ABD1S1R8_9LAMI